MIYVMILVVEIQYQLDKKIFKWIPSSSAAHLFQTWMAPSVTLRWLRREQEQTCWKKQLNCNYHLGENSEFIRVVLPRLNNCCLPIMCLLLNDQLFPGLPMSQYEWVIKWLHSIMQWSHNHTSRCSVVLAVATTLTTTTSCSGLFPGNLCKENSIKIMVSNESKLIKLARSHNHKNLSTIISSHI